MTESERLSQQIQFVLEIDKLKGVFRRTWLIDRSRRENDAEHSWHLAVLALLLSEYAAEKDLDLLRVLELVLGLLAAWILVTPDYQPPVQLTVDSRLWTLQL